jgi:tRNA-specific 2-thiouridylase
MGERIVVAMSGGVDSAVAAARLHDDGYDVIGVTLHLWDYPDAGPGAHARCCAPEDQYDARRTADALGFPHYAFDRRAMFEERVVAPFVESYLRGATPSPCTECNRNVKLGELFAIAKRLGAARVATGHYARTQDGFVARGRDRDKDQSYFLYAVPPALIERLVFPLGESTKPEVRSEALARRLPGAGKGESQELCFVGAGAGAYAEFVDTRAKDRVRPGPILDGAGKIVGEHAGIHRFTIGQRKGLGVALGTAAFVTAIDAKSGAVHLGSEGSLLASAAELRDVVVHPKARVPFRCTARIRYRHEGAAAHFDGTTLRFDAPVRAISPGQVAVLYDEERVLCGGTISASPPERPP